MKKYLLSSITIIMLVVLLFSGYAYSAVISDGGEKKPYVLPDLSSASGEEILAELDKQMHYLYSDIAGDPKIPENGYYFGLHNPVYGLIRYDWLKYDFQREKAGYDAPFLLSPVMYNSANKVQLYNDGKYALKSGTNNSPKSPDPLGKITVNYAGAGNMSVPVWGIDSSGHWHVDWEQEEAYWFESGWSGYRFCGNHFGSGHREVLTWKRALEVLQAQREWERYHYYDDSPFRDIKTLPGLPEDILETLIQEGVDYIWGGKTGYDVDLRCRDTGYVAYQSRRGAPVHLEGEKPPDKSWRDVVLIMLPPTYISWGRGVRFSADVSNANIIYALDIPIAPIAMIMYDLSASFIPLPDKAKAEEPVTLTLEVTSTFDREVTTDYIWQIVGLPEDEVEFLDGAASGEITLQAMETKQLRISFTMPENDVQAIFEINPALGITPDDTQDADEDDASAGRKVKENGNYENNMAEHVVEEDSELQPPENIPPWVLTKELSFTVRSSATLTKPRGSWVGNASGSLEIENGSEDIYNDFEVHNNPPVNERPPTIRRNPLITATLDRADFGDDPKEGSFAPNSLPDGTPLSMTGVVTGSGSVEASYKWTEKEHDDGPPPRSYSVTYYGDASADFTPINDEQIYTFDVYNGLTKERLRQKTIKAEVTRNPLKQLNDRKANREYKYDLTWEGTHYTFGGDAILLAEDTGEEVKLIRWMCHRHADDSEYGWEPLDCQYERTFIGKSSGSVTWQTVETLKESYQEDRQAALERKSGKAYYKNVIFATDKQFESVDWPVKSGYYLNPMGIYKCTLETEQYKTVYGPTDEHLELVESIKAAFSYQSGLVYVNSKQEYSTLGAITEEKPRGLLTIDDESADIPYDPLPTSLEQDRAGSIDPLIKEVLEGYRESGTQSNSDLYKYREQTDLVIYRIVEKTEILFTIAVPSGYKMYTHVNMKNGDYVVRANVLEIEFDFEEYLEIDGAYPGDSVLTMPKFTMDDIIFSVRGSMYDDRN